jgi:hypothetical protein
MTMTSSRISSSSSASLASRFASLGPGTIAVIFLAVAGAILRIDAYLQNRTLWIDEAMLARNVLGRTIAQLMQPLAYAQGAPLGYLAADKLAVLLLGRNEYGLRLISILSGTAALAVFGMLTTRALDQKTRVVACALFAACPPLVYYSAEAKQYASDTLVSTVLLYCAIRLYESESTTAYVMLGVVGSIAIWLSHPAVFILGTIGLSIAWSAVRAKDATRLVAVCLIAIAWIGSVGAVYALNLRSLLGNGQLEAYWSAGFMPLRLGAALRWAGTTYWATFSTAFGEVAGGLIAWLFGLGVLSLTVARRPLAWLSIGPYALLLVASTFHMYPFTGGRLALFALPGAIMGSASGWQAVSSSRSRVVTWTLTALVFLPLPTAALLAARTQREDLRPLIQQMAQQVRPGDRVYVYSGAEPQFTLYANDLGYLSPGVSLQVIQGTAQLADLAAYEAELRPLKGAGRVWVVISHQYSRYVPDGEVLLSAAREYGQEVLTFASPTSSSVRLFAFDHP